MRQLITRAYFKYPWLPGILNPLIALRTALLPEKYRLERRFKRILGYSLDLDRPVTLNEKIQWLKLYDRTELHPICADKYAVRDYIKQKIGEEYLISLVFHSDDPAQIKADKFPDYPFIIKTNHDSSGGIIVWKKEDVNWDEVREIFRKRMKSNYAIFGKGEWQYASIKPMIIAERLLITEDGSIPADFKMHCFNGSLKFTQVDLDRQTNHTRNLYDRDWNYIPVSWLYKNGREVTKPSVYEKMVQLAEKLAKEFIYLRVDFYVVSGNIYFGELTFHSDSGNGKFIPEEWDTTFGNMLKLPIDN